VDIIQKCLVLWKCFAVILNGFSQLFRSQLSELLALYSQELAHQILIIYALSSSEHSLKEHNIHLIKRQLLQGFSLVHNSQTPTHTYTQKGKIITTSDEHPTMMQTTYMHDLPETSFLITSFDFNFRKFGRMRL